MRDGGGPNPLGGFSDDQLGSVTVALVVSELHWTPDVASAVMDRIARDAAAYPEHFDRRPRSPVAAPDAPVVERSLSRTLGRVAVIAAIAILVAALVLVAATANVSGAAAVDPADIAGALVSASEAS
jgi:hypothetical protein